MLIREHDEHEHEHESNKSPRGHEANASRRKALKDSTPISESEVVTRGGEVVKELMSIQLGDSDDAVGIVDD